MTTPASSTAPFRKLIFRPAREALTAMPLGARSVGHYRVPPGWEETRMRKHFVQVFWTVAGQGRILLGGARAWQDLPPGSLAIYYTGDFHDLSNAGQDPWEYRWLTMDGPLVEAILQDFGFERGRVYRAGPPPERLFERLARRIGDISRVGETRAAAVAYELLSEAHAAANPRVAETGSAAPSNDDGEEFSARCLAVIHANWADPGFGIDQLAAALGMHRSVLSRRFHATLGLAPSEYLARWRVQNALSRLKETATPIQEIASDCGWEDANYFARCIRKATGQSPRQFRAGSG